MANIQPNAHGKKQLAQRRLKTHIHSLKLVASMTAAQREMLFVNVLIDLVRLNLAQLNQLDDDD